MRAYPFPHSPGPASLDCGHVACTCPVGHGPRTSLLCTTAAARLRRHHQVYVVSTCNPVLLGSCPHRTKGKYTHELWLSGHGNPSTDTQASTGALPGHLRVPSADMVVLSTCCRPHLSTGEEACTPDPDLLLGARNTRAPRYLWGHGPVGAVTVWGSPTLQVALLTPQVPARAQHSTVQWAPLARGPLPTLPTLPTVKWRRLSVSMSTSSRKVRMSFGKKVG